jgi:hypothetical protein
MLCHNMHSISMFLGKSLSRATRRRSLSIRQASSYVPDADRIEQS